MLHSNYLRSWARLAALSLSFLVVFSMFGVVHAQTQGIGTNSGSPVVGIGTNSGSTNACGQESGTIANPLKYCSLEALLSGVLKSLIQVGSIILTLALVFVGFKFVAARGNEEKISSAKSALLWTIIGGLILLGATAIQVVITSTVSSITP